METTTHPNAPTTTTTDTLLLTLDEAARELRCARRSVERQIARHRPTVVHLGMKANVAIHKLLTMIWHMGTTGALYEDPGADYFTKLHPKVTLDRVG